MYAYIVGPTNLNVIISLEGTAILFAKSFNLPLFSEL